jgi:DNA polymerase phi
MTTTLECFWDLSATDKAKRLDASERLVDALEKFQAQHQIPEDDDGVNDLERNNAPDVAYAIKRLVRGLASPRESSRLGFSVALTEVRIPPKLLLTLWDDNAIPYSYYQILIRCQPPR